MLCVFEFHLTGRKYDEKQAQEPSFWREPISAMTPRTSLFPTGFSASAVWVSRLGLLPLLPVLVGHCQAVIMVGCGHHGGMRSSWWEAFCKQMKRTRVGEATFSEGIYLHVGKCDVGRI